MSVNNKKNFVDKRNKQQQIVDLGLGRLPPQSCELEEAVLGAAMLEKDTFNLVAEIIPNAQVFYMDAHQKIYAAMKRLFERGTPVDLLTIVEELRKTNELEIVGGAYYLTKLTMSVITSAHIDTHARIIMEKYMMRELIRIGGSIVSDAYNDETDVFDLLGQAQTHIFDLASGTMRKKYATAQELAIAAGEWMEYMQAHKNELTGVTTGYTSLDNLTNGWQKTDLIILAARPSVGKTAFVINLAINAAQKTIYTFNRMKGVWEFEHTDKYKGVGVFSLEMSAKQVTNRILSILSRIPLESIQNGRLQPDEFKRFTDAQLKLSTMNMKIDDTAGLTLFEFGAKGRKMVSEGVELILIDYLQLMSGDEKNGNREQEISRISRGLKKFAKEWNVPIIALSQLGRAVEERKGGKPKLSDLRESGAIEQDADIVIFLSRPDYQLDAEGRVKLDPQLQDDVYITFAKHRNGSIEELVLKFVKGIQTFFSQDNYECYRQFGTGNAPGGDLYQQNNNNQFKSAGNTKDDLPF